MLKKKFMSPLTTKYGMACLAHEMNLSITSASLGWKIQYQKNAIYDDKPKWISATYCKTSVTRDQDNICKLMVLSILSVWTAW